MIFAALPSRDAFFETVIYLITTYHQYFITGILYTVMLSVIGTIGGFIIASGFTLIRTQKIDRFRQSRLKNNFISFGHFIVDAYVTLFRGTPMMVQAMIFYYGLSRLQLSFWTPFIAGIVVVTLNTTAYIAEVLRSGINGVPKGQLEAARSLGFSHNQSMIYVILPQAVKQSLPAIANEFIINLKDTSVLSVIGVTELFRATQLATAPNYRTTEGFFVAAVLYLTLTFIASRLVNYFEKKPIRKTKLVNS
jgi:putative lysine transport system permease protein